MSVLREITPDTIKWIFPKLHQKHNETFLHHTSKSVIACFLNDLYKPERLSLEYTVPGTYRKRADIYFECRGKKIIHEVQLSSQQWQLTEYRTKIYKRIGNIDKIVWWFLITDNQNIDFCQDNGLDFGMIYEEYTNSISYDLYEYYCFSDGFDGYSKYGFDFIS